jgi:hypothetical protein
LRRVGSAAKLKNDAAGSEGRASTRMRQSGFRQ